MKRETRINLTFYLSIAILILSILSLIIAFTK